jgi:adenine deaminase
MITSPRGARYRAAVIDVFRLPKAELHLHIEGTLEPELMFALAKKNGISLPYPDVESVERAYVFKDLQSFLDIYYLACAVLIDEEDFFELTMAYLRRAHAQGVRHAEVFFDPQTHTDRGVPMRTIVDGIHRALEAGRAQLGITSYLILCFLRHLSEESALATLEEALAFRDRIVAVGLDSGERGNPPAKFVRAFDRARAEGFHAVAHAGEEGPAGYIWEALDLLHVERVDHGVRALDDDLLVERLVRERVPLTVCPLSNVRLRVNESLAVHPLRELAARGLLVTVNSDDPAYFGGYVADNFVAVRDALQIPDDELVQYARNSFEASFLPEADKAAHLAELDRIV